MFINSIAFLRPPVWLEAMFVIMEWAANFLHDVETRLVSWASCHAVDFLRITVGGIYVLFGGLKYSDGSAAEVLAGKTIQMLSMGIVEPRVSLPLLATAEVLIGLGLVSNLSTRIIFPFLMGHMIGTFSPLVLLPGETFSGTWPYAPTLVGQYILKNCLIVGTAFVLVGTARGGQWTVACPIRKTA